MVETYFYPTNTVATVPRNSDHKNNNSDNNNNNNNRLQQQQQSYTRKVFRNKANRHKLRALSNQQLADGWTNRPTKKATYRVENGS